MQIIADLQIHSRFSRAVSKEMTLPNIYAWAKRKGIGLVATGDFTHPMWFREIERNLEETGNGLLQIKNQKSKIKNSNQNSNSEINEYNFEQNALKQTHLPALQPLFLLATEVSCIYTQGGKGRRVHTLVWVPSIESARKINNEMTKRGCNLMSDGRPIIGLTSIDVAELVLTIEPKALVIPAHAWTPWFSLYGSKSGFDSIDEAFGPYAKYIYAVETGLSSSPDMNWRIKELDNRAILSFSDAHSGPKIGREATVFEIGTPLRQGYVGRGEQMFGYEDIYEAIAQKTVDDRKLKIEKEVRESKIENTNIASNINSPNQSPTIYQPSSRIAFTIEFYPEEGKYHYTGHRACNIRLTPEETVKSGTTCSVCGKPLTQGVMQRVEELAGRSQSDLQLTIDNVQLTKNSESIRLTKSGAFPERPGFVSLVPLQEIISESIGSPVTSNKTQILYSKLTDQLQSEFNILLFATKEEIAQIAGEKVAEGIDKVRRGDIVIDPGYDGVFGIVKIWKEGEESLVDESKKQISMF